MRPRPGTGSLELAHARLWARWGQRADAAQWRRIEVTRDLASVMALARAGPLGHWLAGLEARPGLHAVDRRLRTRWRAVVDELAAWLPEDWHDALRWCALLPDLPRWQCLARARGAGEKTAAAIAGDEELQPWLDTVSPTLKAAHGRLSGTLTEEADQALEAWLACWEALLPEGRGRAQLCEQLVPTLLAHRQGFAAAHPADAGGLRLQLQARLLQAMRLHPLQPLCAFAFLGLQALELERLRGEIVRRAAFPAQGVTP